MVTRIAPSAESDGCNTVVTSYGEAAVPVPLSADCETWVNSRNGAPPALLALV
ncbi:hypothetical protein D3C71_2036640 [compost metagenome]